MSTAPRAVVVEADGGSRGNPGPAAYGALVKDARTGEVLAERGEAIGTASNNVAEYRGLIAGLELVAEHAPDAEVEVRMDSKLVVEQMSGRWKIKHPAMRPLAMQAQGLAPFGTRYTWVPRAQNKAADRLVNEALDGKRDATGPLGAAARAVAPVTEPAEAAPAPRGWGEGTEVTTLVLVRHGSTAATGRKLFSGGLSGADPSLSDEGRAQVRATADWLAALADSVDALVTSPVRRAVETAQVLGERWGRRPVEEPGLAEMDFGSWEGLTFAEVRQRQPAQLDAWLGDPTAPAGGGESFAHLAARVREARDRLLAAHRGRTVVVVAHVTPIKVLVADALGAGLDALFRMELAPASVTVVGYHATADSSGDPEAPADPGGARPSLRLFNAQPPESPLL